MLPLPHPRRNPAGRVWFILRPVDTFKFAAFAMGHSIVNRLRGRGPAAMVLTLTMLAAPAVHAQGNARVLAESIGIAGVLGGLVLGAAAALWTQSGLKFWPSFCIFLGALCLLASTRFGTLEVVPLTLALGALLGGVPFGLGFWAAKSVVGRAMRRRRERKGVQ